MERPFAGDDTTGRYGSAVRIDGGLGGPGHGGVSRHAQIVVAGEVEDLAPIDDRGVAGYSLVNSEEGMSKAQTLQRVETSLQREILGEQLDVMVRGRDRVGPSGATRLGGEEARQRVDGWIVHDERRIDRTSQPVLEIGRERHRRQRVEPV